MGKIPPSFISGERLKRVKMLNVFESSTLQLGDKSLYKLAQNDAIVSLDEWKKIEADNRGLAKANNDKPKKATRVKRNRKRRAKKAKLNVAAKAKQQPEVPNNKDDDDANSSSYEDLSDDEDDDEQVQRSRPLESPNQKQKVKTFQVGEELVVESLCTTSSATVIWQVSFITPLKRTPVQSGAER